MISNFNFPKPIKEAESPQSLRIHLDGQSQHSAIRDNGQLSVTDIDLDSDFDFNDNWFSFDPFDANHLPMSDDQQRFAFDLEESKSPDQTAVENELPDLELTDHVMQSDAVLSLTESGRLDLRSSLNRLLSSKRVNLFLTYYFECWHRN